MTDLSILEQALLTCDAPESVWRPALDALKAQIDDLKSAGRQARDDATAALVLVSRIRMALNDNGKRMQDELIDYCRDLAQMPYRIQKLEMQAQSQWTPTSESLPPEASKCLISTDDGILQASYVHSGMFFSHGIRERPSHWMLQPEPPAK